MIHTDLHLRAVRQILGHVGVDTDKRHQRRAHTGQDEHDDKQELAFFDDESCDLLHGLRNSFRAPAGSQKAKNQWLESIEYYSTSAKNVLCLFQTFLNKYIKEAIL